MLSMSITYISATKARQDFFELLKRVYYKKEEIVIKLHNKPVARLISSKKRDLSSKLKPVLKLKKPLSEKAFLQLVEKAKANV